MDTNALKEALKQAERAVAEMPEGDLRVEAFKIILNRVLAESGSQVPTQKDAGNAPHREKSRTRQRRGDSHEGVVPHSVPARILTLKTEGFFAEQRGIGEIRDELQTHGWRYKVTALSGPLMRLVRERELRRSKVDDDGKTTYKYFNP